MQRTAANSSIERMLARLFSLAAVALLLSGCKSLYFEPAGRAPEPAPQHRLAEWPDREYWSAVVFNGEKIGFSHLSIGAAEAPGLFELRSDAAFVLRFLGFDKRVNLKAYDLVRPDLELVAFRYEYMIDGNAVMLDGKRSGDALAVTIRQAGSVAEQTVEAPAPVYPVAATVLYPSLRGLAPGREFRYCVYSGELQKLSEVSQRIVAYERSTLFEGEAFRVETARRLGVSESDLRAPRFLRPFHGVRSLARDRPSEWRGDQRSFHCCIA